MRLWKWLGLAGLVGISTTGAVLLVRRRHWRAYDADELRARLHARLDEANSRGADATGVPPTSR